MNSNVLNQYCDLLLSYCDNPKEEYLFKAGTLGQELVEAGTPPEDLAEMHESALARFVVKRPDITLKEANEKVSVLFMELFMAYGMAYRQQVYLSKKAEEERRRSQENLNNLFKFTTDAIFIQNRKREILDCNAAAEEMFGYSREELVSDPTIKLGDQEKTGEDQREEYLQRAIQGQPQRFEWWGKRKDGSSFPEEIILNRTIYNGEEAVFVTIRNITERKQMLEELNVALKVSQQQQAEISAVLKSTRAVLEYREFEEAARTIFDSCKNLIGATAGYVALLTPNETENDVLFLDSGGLTCTVDPTLPMPIRGLREEAYNTGKAVFHNDFSNSEWAEFMPEGHADLYNVLFAPLVIEDKAVGLMGVANKPGGFTEKDAKMASAFGELAAIALRNSRMLESIKESEEKYRGIFDESVVTIYLFDAQKNFIDSNQAGLDLLGYSREELLKMSIPDVDADPEAVLPAHKKLLAGDRIVNYEHKLKRKDGSIITVLNNSRPLTDIDGNVVGMQSTLIDITERKRAEEALRESEERYRLILENIEEGYYEVDLKGNFIFFNDSLCKMLNYSRDELTGMNNRHYMDSESAERVYKVFNEVFRTEKSSKTIDIKIKRKDGKINYGEISISLLKDSNNKAIGFRGIVRDITERKRTEKALQESEESYRGIYEYATDAIYIQDREGRFLDVNQGAVDMYGYPKEFFIGKTPEPLAAPGKNDMKQIAKYIERTFKGESQQFEFWGRRKNGEVFPKIVRLNKGHYFGQEVMIAFALDITERKQAEEKIKQQLDELQRWHGLTLDREDRIQELKREVNELLRQHNEKIRYPSQESLATQ